MYLQEIFVRVLLDECPQLYVFVLFAYLHRHEYLLSVDDQRQRLLFISTQTKTTDFWETIEDGAYNFLDLIHEVQEIRMSRFCLAAFQMIYTDDPKGMLSHQLLHFS